MIPPKKFPRQLLKLTPCNFTPLSKTPWAGRTLRENYKKHLKPQENIGESWELSFAPSMSSKLESTGEKLFHLGPSLKEEFRMRKEDNFNLLVKLLSAGKNLSIQVHPDYDDQNLGEDECGKYESWFILEAEKDAGIYLGFKDHVTIEDVKHCLSKKEDMSELLNFIPVKKGDYFDLPPGTVHAIGAGVTLLEPQRVLFGNQGVTYRFWDWNRRYNEKGEEDKKGKERKLHTEACLRILEKEENLSRPLLNFKKQAEILEETPTCERKIYQDNPYYKLEIIRLKKGSKWCSLEIDSFYAHLFVLEGKAFLEQENRQKILLNFGDSFLLGPGKSPLVFKSEEDISLALLSEK